MKLLDYCMPLPDLFAASGHGSQPDEDYGSCMVHLKTNEDSWRPGQSSAKLNVADFEALGLFRCDETPEQMHTVHQVLHTMFQQGLLVQSVNLALRESIKGGADIHFGTPQLFVQFVPGKSGCVSLVVRAEYCNALVGKDARLSSGDAAPLLSVDATLSLRTKPNEQGLYLACGDVKITSDHAALQLDQPSWLVRFWEYLLQLFSQSEIKIQTAAPEKTLSGITNIGNTCYLATALSMMATSEPYYQAVVGQPGRIPDTPEAAELRRILQGVLDRVRSDLPVQAPAMNSLRKALIASKLLSPSDAKQQHDAGEFLGKIMEYLDPQDVAGLGQTVCTIYDFGQAKDVAYEDAAEGLPLLDDHYVMRESEKLRSVWLNLPSEQPMDMAQLVEYTMGQNLSTVTRNVRFENKIIHAAPIERMVFDGSANAITFGLQRTNGLGKKNQAQVKMSEFVKIGDTAYRLTGIGYHSGDETGGHYTASTYNGKTGGWDYRNDAEVIRNDPAFKLRSVLGRLYTYSRIDALPDGVQATELPKM